MLAVFSRDVGDRGEKLKWSRSNHSGQLGTGKHKRAVDVTECFFTRLASKKTNANLGHQPYREAERVRTLTF
jgi:hypothetical protein